MQTHLQTLSGLMGLCGGDALSVPVEFTTREERGQIPVTTMLSYVTWNVPAGTWSDDSSLTLFTEYSLEAIANSFCRWYNQAYWTPHGEVFDIGNATYAAIMRWQQGLPLEEVGGRSEAMNDNGALMRILPMAYCHKIWDFPQLIERVHQVSSITHAHLRSLIACGIYISIAVCLLQGLVPQAADLQGLKNIQNIYSATEYASEITHFDRVFRGEIAELPTTAINSGGYVIDTLEASLWCLLNSSSYTEAVLKAVNLGGDTDTTAAVTGGLAGIYYGVKNIPQAWMISNCA